MRLHCVSVVLLGLAACLTPQKTAKLEADGAKAAVCILTHAPDTAGNVAIDCGASEAAIVTDLMAAKYAPPVEAGARDAGSDR